jgi:hypothetical protein
MVKELILTLAPTLRCVFPVGLNAFSCLGDWYEEWLTDPEMRHVMKLIMPGYDFGGPHFPHGESSTGGKRNSLEVEESYMRDLLVDLIWNACDGAEGSQANDRPPPLPLSNPFHEGTHSSTSSMPPTSPLLLNTTHCRTSVDDNASDSESSNCSDGDSDTDDEISIHQSESMDEKEVVPIDAVVENTWINLGNRRITLAKRRGKKSFTAITAMISREVLCDLFSRLVSSFFRDFYYRIHGSPGRLLAEILPMKASGVTQCTEDTCTGKCIFMGKCKRHLSPADISLRNVEANLRNRKNKIKLTFAFQR